MANTAERAYGLTILSPIVNGTASTGEPHDRAIRRELLAFGDGESPLANVPTTHLARWVVIDALPYEGIPARLDQLAHKHLLFTSNFDGKLDDYLELLRTRIPDVVDRLWSHCVGFPGAGDRLAFGAYMKRCQVETTFFFGAYTAYTLEQVLRALDLQRRMARFVADRQATGGTPATLRQAFRELMAEASAAPTPRPGSI